MYEPRFPRTKVIRWGYVASRLMQMAICGFLQYAVLRQFMLPVLAKAQPLAPAAVANGRPASHPLVMGASTAASLAFDMMKLAMPSLIVWLLGFYAIFACWLNVVAEVTRYADRVFYQRWWNASDLATFWKRWNIPVHEWCLRHVYLDLVSHGVSRRTAVLATFFFSAVAHELICLVAFKSLRPWFFVAMLLQLPLMAAAKPPASADARGGEMKGDVHGASGRAGNYLVWWSLFTGQPLLEVLYFREWFATMAAIAAATAAASSGGGRHEINFFCGGVM